MNKRTMQGPAVNVSKLIRARAALAIAEAEYDVARRAYSLLSVQSRVAAIKVAKANDRVLAAFHEVTRADREETDRARNNRTSRGVIRLDAQRDRGGRDLIGERRPGQGPYRYGCDRRLAFFDYGMRLA